MPDRIRFTRREALAAGAVAITTAGLASADTPRKSAMKGNIKQSVVAWCFMVGGDKCDRSTNTCEVTKGFGASTVGLKSSAPRILRLSRSMASRHALASPRTRCREPRSRPASTIPSITTNWLLDTRR